MCIGPKLVGCSWTRLANKLEVKRLASGEEKEVKHLRKKKKTT